MKNKCVMCLMLAILCFFIPLVLGATQNRIVLSEGDRIKLLEYNSQTQTFDLIWESAEIGLGPRLKAYGIKEPLIIDIDADGNNEVVAIDQFGIFIWGKNGKYPKYFAFENALVPSRYTQITMADIDGDSNLDLVTQRQKESGEYMGVINEYQRRISAWAIVDDRLISKGWIDLPGVMSWSLRHGDFDGDGQIEILTSSNLIHVLGWEPGQGFVVESVIPNLSSLVDVVRPADIDGDTIPEIIASGNSGGFSIYKHRKIHDQDYYPLYFQIQPDPNNRRLSQGLHFLDVNDDDTGEILVGLTSRTGTDLDNIYVYERTNGMPHPMGVIYEFSKIFSMPFESSGIPGFVIGDADNDGRNEFIYNDKYVMRFAESEDGNLELETLDQFSKRGTGSAIGEFNPTGIDKPDGLRLIPTALALDLNGDGYIQSESTYQFRIKLISPWENVSSVKVEVDCGSDDVIIENKAVLIQNIQAGQEIETSEDAFRLSTRQVTSLSRFGLKIIITTDQGYRLEQVLDTFQSSVSPLGQLVIRPKLSQHGDTLAISSGEDTYAALGVEPEYFNDGFGVTWPGIEILKLYNNLILYDQYSYAFFMHQRLIEEFLDIKGNLFVHGYSVIPKFEEPIPTHMAPLISFVDKYCRARRLGDTSQLKGLYGAKDDFLTEGVEFDLIPNHDGNRPGVLQPLEGGIPILFYPNGEVAAIRVDGPFKLVHLSFCLNDIESTETQEILLKRTLEWFRTDKNDSYFE